MKVRTLVVGVIATTVSAVGLGGVAAAVPAQEPSSETRQAPTPEQCQQALQRLQERQANLQTRLEQLQSWLAKAQEAGRAEAVEKIQGRIQKLQERLARNNERVEKVNSRCAQPQS